MLFGPRHLETLPTEEENIKRRRQHRKNTLSSVHSALSQTDDTAITCPPPHEKTWGLAPMSPTTLDSFIRGGILGHFLPYECRTKKGQIIFQFLNRNPTERTFRD